MLRLYKAERYPVCNLWRYQASIMRCRDAVSRASRVHRALPTQTRSSLGITRRRTLLYWDARALAAGHCMGRIWPCRLHIYQKSTVMTMTSTVPHRQCLFPKDCSMTSLTTPSLAKLLASMALGMATVSPRKVDSALPQGCP